MMDFLKEWEEKLGIKITCSQVRRVQPLRLPQHSSTRTRRTKSACQRH